MTAILNNFIQNGSNIDLNYKTYIITEDMCDVVVDSTKGVAPYNTSYGMTWITIKNGYGIEWREGRMYRFIINTKLVVVSATRNVGIRIGTGEYIPVKNWANSILAGSSYFAKGRTDEYMYKTTYESGGALHVSDGSNTTYSALAVANVTSSNTTAKVVSGKIFKDSVTALAVLLTGNQTIAGTKTFSTSPVVPSKTTAATNTGTAIATEAQVYLKANNADVVKLTGNQTVAGTKTFSTSPVVPSKTADVANTGTAIATEAQVYKILPTVMTASEYSQVSNPVAGKIYFIKES